jgi:hypothetical protein
MKRWACGRRSTSSSLEAPSVSSSFIALSLHGAPVDADYGLREFAVVDADGNLLRIGSPLRQAG